MSSLAPGNYTLVLQGVSQGATISVDVPFVIMGATPGTITVMSVDANDTSTFVPAAWDLTASTTNTKAPSADDGSFVCSATGALTNAQGTQVTFPWSDGTLCSGTKQTYNNVPTYGSSGDLVGVPPTAIPLVPGYALRSIEQVPVVATAEKKDNSILGMLQLSLRNIFSTPALAQEYVTEQPLGSTPTHRDSATLTSQYPSAAFIILWAKNPTSTSGGYSCVNNACSAVASGAQYTSLSSCNAACHGGGGTHYICPSNVCETTSTSGANSCAAACGNSPSSLTAVCTPASIGLSQTSQCELDLGGIKQNGTWSVKSGSAGSIGKSSGIYTPSSAGTEFVIGALPDGSSAQASIDVAPSQLPDCSLTGKCPVCSPGLTASPSSIVVPESSNLSYSCTNVTQCQISGAATGRFSTPTDVPASGSYNVSPTSTTAYTLACVNSDYAQDGINNPFKSSVTVTVGGSTYCEQNPNGVGCQ